jgi:hypothetical protein
MVAFIDEQREVYGVGPICEVLPIAPSTYYAHRVMQADPSLRSARAKRDAWLKVEIQTRTSRFMGPRRSGGS